MANNVIIKDGSGNTVTLAAKDISGSIYPKHITTDGSGNDVDWTIDKNLNSGLKISLQDPLTDVDLDLGQVNNTWLVRSSNGQEAFYSTQRAIITASIAHAWDAGRTNGQGTSSYRRVTMPSSIRELASNDASASYQGQTTPTRLFRYFGNNSTAVQYLKIWDRNNTPTIGVDAPTYTFRIPVGDFERSLDGLTLQAGFYFTFHTTRTGTTLTTAAQITDFGILKG